MNVYKPSQLAEKLKVSKETLRLWAERGKIKITKTDGGHRRYIYNEEVDNKEINFNFIYARVSSKKHEDDLKRQVKFLQELYPKYKVITDIGSGINFNRKGFNNIIKAVIAGTVKEIVVAHKDRLCRFGFELIENLCKHFSTTITVINDNDDKSTESELAEDLLSIITVFTARFYGKRKYNKNKNKNETKNDKKYRKERNTVYNNKNKNIPKSTATNII
jgi:excisionase family DNA binding protein